jgi:tetrahydromethanopterin S-methyltransferase subunit F
MKGTDKFLIGLVIGIVLLVVVAFSVVLLRSKPEYRSDDSPEAVVHNYLLALRQGDYERAYECLSSNLESYPEDIEAFVEDINDRKRVFSQNRDVALNVQPAKIVGNTAIVEVLETTFYSGGPLESGQDERRFDMKLRQEDGKWKLFDGDRYWNFSWNR